MRIKAVTETISTHRKQQDALRALIAEGGYRQRSSFDYRTLKVGDPVYRLHDPFAAYQPFEPELVVLRVTKLTPAGYYAGYGPDHDPASDHLCLNHTDRKHAYPELREALRSYRRRKQAQQRRALSALVGSTRALSYLGEVDALDNAVEAMRQRYEAESIGVFSDFHVGGDLP